MNDVYCSLVNVSPLSNKFETDYLVNDSMLSLLRPSKSICFKDSITINNLFFMWAAKLIYNGVLGVFFLFNLLFLIGQNKKSQSLKK